MGCKLRLLRTGPQGGGFIAIIHAVHATVFPLFPSGNGALYARQPMCGMPRQSGKELCKRQTHVMPVFDPWLRQVVPCSQQRTMMEVIRTGMKHRKVGLRAAKLGFNRLLYVAAAMCWPSRPIHPHNTDQTNALNQHALQTPPRHYQYGGPTVLRRAPAGGQPPAQHGVQQVTCHLHRLL